MARTSSPWSAAFRWFWAGEAVSGFGAWIAMLGLQAVVVTTLQAGTTGTGLLNAARWLPYLLFGVLIGAVIDRHARRPVMIGTDLARAVILLLVPIAWWSDVLTLPLLLVIVALFGTATLANDSASQSFVPRLVPTPSLQRAHARLDGTAAVAEVAGPSTGGVLLALVSAPVALVATAATCLFSAGAVAMSRVAEAPNPPRAQRNLRREVAEGLRWVYRDGALRDLAIWTHVWFAGQAALGAVLAVYLLVTMGLSPIWFGLVMAASGAGAVVGALCSSAAGRRLGSGRTVIAAHVLSASGVLVLITAQVTPAPLAVALLCLGQAFHGAAIGGSNSHEMTYRQSITPDALQGRTNTTMRSMNRAVVVVFAPLAGLVASLVGLEPVMITAAALFALAAIGLWRSPFRHAVT